MGKKPTSTRREPAKRVVRDLSSRVPKARAIKGGGSVRGQVQRVAVLLPCEREP